MEISKDFFNVIIFMVYIYTWYEYSECKMIYWKTYEFWMGVYLVLGKFISLLISPFIAEENYFLFDDMT